MSQLVGVASALTLLVTAGGIINMFAIVGRIDKMHDDITSGLEEFRVSYRSLPVGTRTRSKREI